MNVQKESLKNNLQGSHKLPQAHEKMCDENESRSKEKNEACVKMLLIEGGSL